MRLNNRNELAAKYLEGELAQFFPYAPFHSTEERLEDLQERTFNREELVSVLTSMNRGWGAPEVTLAQIERLGDEDSVVVVGGQQAGLLTGPLYTIHKIISIIKYAKEQEAILNIPVIPVFWIAGEDHDYDEINHMFTTANNTLNKRIIKQEEWQKRPISSIPLDKELTKEWVMRVFHDLTETKHTRHLATAIFEHVDASDTFVDFFARFTFDLFKNEGLVLIDSGDERLRQLESKIFEQLIHKQTEITNAIFATSQKIHHEGFSVQVDITEQDGNLFYHDENDERILLIRKNGRWIGKSDEVEFTTDELLKIAKQEPHQLSNNVMTRPIMQEALLPTLAFIAGDGEISYWALLKDAFTAFDYKMTMPPVVPRLSITLVTERINKLLASRILDASYVVNKGCSSMKVNWLSTQENPPVHLMFEQAKAEIKDIYGPIQQLSASIGPDLGAEARRNLEKILKEIQYMENRTIKHLQDRYEKELAQFEEIQLALRPNDGLQERVLNILSFLNVYGPSIINDMMDLDLPFTEDHHLIYMNQL